MEPKHELGSPLEWAVPKGHNKTVEILLKAGASPDGIKYEKKKIPPPLIMSVST